MMPRLITLACLACGLAAGAGRAAIGERTPDFAAVLTRAGQVLDLPEAEAARAVPVQLRGVVVGEAPPIGKGFVLWDGQDSIYVRDETAGASGTFGRGDEVEIEGVSNAGGFTPSVIMTAGRRLGRGEPPAPRPVTADELLAGRYDAEWVRLRGIVRRCEPSTAWAGRWRLALVSGGQSFTVHVNAELAPAVLIDAAVAVDALVFNQHNLSRQAVSVLLFVPAGVPVGSRCPRPRTLLRHRFGRSRVCCSLNAGCASATASMCAGRCSTMNRAGRFGFAMANAACTSPRAKPIVCGRAIW